MSKGSKQRPTDQQKFSDGYELAFGKKDQLGLSKAANASGSNPDNSLVRVQQPPPIYIDPQTGKEVSENWWPDVQ